MCEKGKQGQKRNNTEALRHCCHVACENIQGKNVNISIVSAHVIGIPFDLVKAVRKKNELLVNYAIMVHIVSDLML